MADLKMKIGDGTSSQDQVGGSPIGRTPKRSTYEVVAETGIFKNGKTYKRGEKVELDDRTAKSAIEAGDVRELQA